jgi:hypothetical protein
MDKKEKYIKIERINETIAVQMNDADEIDLLAIAIHLISDVSQEMKIPPEQILEFVKSAFAKGLVDNSGRIYPGEINKENMN